MKLASSRSHMLSPDLFRGTSTRFDRIEEEVTDYYIESFSQADLDGDSKLNVEEFKEALRIHLGKAIPIEQVMPAFQKFDKSGDGAIDMQEFVLALHYIERTKIRCTKSGKKSLCSDFLIKAAELSLEDDDTLREKLLTSLYPYRRLLCVQEDGELLELPPPKDAHPVQRQSFTTHGLEYRNPDDPEFKSPYSPTQMRCLALVSHNAMKSTMKEFVVQNANLLKKFRLTGTASTMKMLAQVFKGDPKVVYGPTCMSGPLGGDAQLVAQMCSNALGGMIFFQDPMDSHPHDADIACLNRQALIYNVPTAVNPASGLMMVNQLRMALMDNKPQYMPSFFFTLQCPSVQAYKEQQAAVVAAQTVQAHKEMMGMVSDVDIVLNGR